MKTEHATLLCLSQNNTLCLKPEFFLHQSQQSGWNQQTVQGFAGFNCFETGRIGETIQLTRSHCQPDQDYHCQILHPQATTLILFGEAGISHFAFQSTGDIHQITEDSSYSGQIPQLSDSLAKETVYTVRPGDLWLINLTDAPLLRMTPSHTQCRMQVLKYASHRLYDTMGIQGQMESLGNRAIRLARQTQLPPALKKLAQNPLSHPVDRLMAEASALELIAGYINLLIEDGAAGITPSEKVTVKGLSAGHTDNMQRYASMVPEVDLAREKLISDLACPPSLDELAQLTGMSHTRLNRAFKQALGCTVFSWLRQYRLEQACQALRSSKEEISNIANRLGFSHASHFSTQFRQYQGCTPKEYRQKNLAG